MSTLKTNKIQSVSSQAPAIQLEANNDITFIGNGLSNTGATLRISNPNTSTFATSTLDFYANNKSRVLIRGGSGSTVNTGVFTISTAGSNGILIDDFAIDENGNIGIGTLSPTTKLDVNGSMRLFGTGPITLILEADTDNAIEQDNPKIYFKQDGGIVQGRIGYANDSNALEFVNQYPDSIFFGTNGSARVTIDSSGRVGINQTSPTSNLHVVGSANITSSLTVGTNLDVTGNVLFQGNVSISQANTYLKLSEITHSPSYADPGTLNVYSKKLAGRQMLGYIGPTGLDVFLNPHIGRNRVRYLAAVGNSTTAPAAFPGTQSFTTVGTATARNWASTNILTRSTRIAYVSASAATSQMSSLRWTIAQFSTGDGSGLGGFHFITRFGVSDAVTVARMFVGVSSNTGAASNVEPSTLTNSIGVAKLAADTSQWYLVYGGSAAQSAIALGTALGAPTAQDTIWEIALFSSPQENGVVYYQITNIGTGVYASGTLTPTTPGTETPAATTALVPQIWRTNNTSTTAVALDFISLYLETDD